MNRFQRLAQPILRHVAAGKPCPAQMRRDAERALSLLGKPSLKRKSANQQKKAGRAAARQARNEDTAAIREAVLKRAGGVCEHCGFDFYPWDDAEIDHFMGGSGRRSQQQSVETCWGLHRTCHSLRTENYPTAAFWNGSFARHCQKHGYFIRKHIIHNPVSAAAGGGE